MAASSAIHAILDGMKFSTGKATLPVEIDGETYLFKSALSLPLGEISDISAFIPAVATPERTGQLGPSGTLKGD